MRPVCAYSLSFPANAADDIWRLATSWISEWYATNVPSTALRAGWERGTDKPLRLAVDHQLDVSIVGSDAAIGGLLREVHWQFPDADDHTLLWIVDLAVLAGTSTLFTLVLRIASADFELAPARVEVRTPRLIRQLVARGDARIGAHALHLDPLHFDPEHVPDLVLLLCEQSRRHPIVLLSPDPVTQAPAIDPGLLADTIAGLASIYVLSSRWSTYALTDELGKEYSCYNGAVRVYWPRFAVGTNPFGHPLWLPPHLEQLGGSHGFARFLHRMIAGAASFRFVEPEPMRAFRARQADARTAALRAGSATDYESLFDEYVKLDTEARELRARVETLAAENEALRRDLTANWEPATESRASAREPSSDERPDPRTVLDAVEEASRRATHVHFLPDAYESAKASPFKHPSKVYSALLALDDVARRWAEQLAGGASIGSRREAFKQRGFEYKDDISQTAEGRWRDEYMYSYDGKRLLFAPHITIGAKSADRCLSIHMHWDEARRRVVVGHVGRHKTNTLS